MVTFSTVLLSFSLGGSTALALIYVYIASDPTSLRREWFSKIPMGIYFSGDASLDSTKRQRCRKKIKPHAVMNIKGSTYDTWLKELPRSAKQTLTKQVPKRFERENIKVVRKRSRDLTYRHWRAVFEHQSRSYAWPRAIFASMIRFLVASLMVGTVDEFWKVDSNTGENVFLAWSQSIVKGKTFRAMWFYQTKEASAGKYFIWFKSLDISVRRSFQMKGVEFVDLGPSLNERVAQSKEKFGFKNRLDWPYICGYNEGSFLQIE